MSKIIRWEFMGSWWVFWLLCITGIGTPLALLYFVNGVVRIENEMDDPEAFLTQFRANQGRR